MQTYISMLRGINVSGQKKIIMIELKQLYEQQGFTKVQTYIQSGNVVFDSEKSQDYFEISKIIELAIEKKYSFQVPVIVKQAEDLISAIKNNPFPRNIDTARIGITFLEKKPTAENLQKLDGIDYLPDQFIIDGLNIYVHCPESVGNSKLTLNLFESKLKVRATGRNWRTINKLIEMAKK